MKEKIWKIKDFNINDEIKSLVKDEILAKLLAQRGIETKEDIKAFLEPKKIPLISPFIFSDMERAVERIKSAIDNKEKILIWGDFDSDGITSSAILYKTFEKLNANFTYFIPNRMNHGHGLHSGELISFISKEKIKLVITVDCGISNIKEVDLLKSFRIDTIITDHHEAGESLPNAYAIINPKAPNSIKEEASARDINSLCDLCGAGISYKLFLALSDVYPELKEIGDEILSLACVGTISDVVPLKGENRTLVALGLDKINAGTHLGIKELFKDKNDITSIDIAFILTPRINAAGRLEDGKKAFEFLTDKNPSNIKLILEHLDNLNKIRQSMCDEEFEEAVSIIEQDKNIKKEPAIVLYNPDWHIGIIGIVASKIVEKYNKPAFLMTKGEEGGLKCSIRSVKEFHVYNILSNLSEYFSGFGGHSLAGGFTTSQEYSFETIKKAILKTINEMYSDIESENTLEIDLELNGNDINENLLNIISILEPYGEQNETPVFCIKNANYTSHKFVGKENNHLKLELIKDNVNLHCVLWNRNYFTPPKDNLVDIAFVPHLNIFNDIKTIQLDLIDLQTKKEESGIKIYDHRKKEGILEQIEKYFTDTKPDLYVYAKNPSTLSDLKDFPNILNGIKDDEKGGIMLFDYPPALEKFKKIINNKTKIHIMKDNFEENIDYYIKQIYGMLKFACNKKQGEINIEKMAEILCVTEDFISLVLEIFEKENAIRLIEKEKVEIIKQIPIEKVKSNIIFEILEDEFNKINQFKNYLANSTIDEIREILYK